MRGLRQEGSDVRSNCRNLYGVRRQNNTIGGGRQILNAASEARHNWNLCSAWDAQVSNCVSFTKRMTLVGSPPERWGILCIVNQLLEDGKILANPNTLAGIKDIQRDGEALRTTSKSNIRNPLT